MTGRSSVRRRIGDAPKDQLASRIVRPRQSPSRCGSAVYWSAGPSVWSWRFAWRLRRVEPPQLFTGLRIVRRNEAIRPPAIASAARNNFALYNDGPGGVPALIDFAFPSKLSRAGVEGDHIAVRRGVVDHVVVDRERFRSSLTIGRAGGLCAPAALLTCPAARACASWNLTASCATSVSWSLTASCATSVSWSLTASCATAVRRRPLVFPDQIAGGRIESMHGAAR